MADIHHSKVSRRLDEHFSEAVRVLYSAVVRDKRDAARPPRRADQTQPPSDHGAQAVRSDYESSRNCAQRSIAGDFYSANASRWIAHYVADSHGFFDACPRPARCLQEDCIENRPPHGKPAVTKSAVTVIGGKLAVNCTSVWRMDEHSGELFGSGSFHGLKHAHCVENPRRFGTQILRARLVTRESRAIEDEHIESGTRHEKCC
jgi:hypothetical protein